MLKVLLSGVILGLSDGILNPCAYSVLLFLIMYLLTLSAHKRKILNCGIAFVLGAGLMYGIFILTLFKVFDIVFSYYAGLVYKILGTLAIILGIIEIKDFFWYGKGISLKIPESAKPKLEKLIHKATVPSAFVLGLLTSIVNAACTGFYAATYASIVSNVVKDWIIRILLIVWYLTFFALPLIAVVLLLYLGMSIKTFENFYERGKRYMRLALGIILLALGVIFLTNPELIAGLR